MSGLGLFRLHPGFRGSSSSSDEESPAQPPQSNPNRVKRALFGPTDHDENLRFVRQEMKKAKNEAASKWNFDFDSGSPMKGRFSWEEAKPTEVHAVYNLDRLPYLANHTESETKENRVSISPEQSTSQPPIDPLAEPAGSIDDLRTPQQGTSVAASSSSSSELPPPLELGARPKEATNAKEIKLTAMFRSRKSRSKSSSKLRLKRLEGAISSRSPSVKSRSDTISQQRNSPPSDGPVGTKIALEKTEDSNSD